MNLILLISGVNVAHLAEDWRHEDTQSHRDEDHDAGEPLLPEISHHEESFVNKNHEVCAFLDPKLLRERIFAMSYSIQ